MKLSKSEQSTIIARQTQEFLNNGGVIQKIPYGATALNKFGKRSNTIKTDFRKKQNAKDWRVAWLPEADQSKVVTINGFDVYTVGGVEELSGAFVSMDDNGPERFTRAGAAQAVLSLNGHTPDAPGVYVLVYDGLGE